MQNHTYCITKVFNPFSDCTSGSDTTVGTSYVKTSCSGIIKFYVPPEIHVQEPKTGGRVKRLTLSSLIISKYSLCM
ncbi:hypothetical protein GQ457_07G006520 [Hibiscus cannabinus]